jgi:hypothetical protein
MECCAWFCFYKITIAISRSTQLCAISVLLNLNHSFTPSLSPESSVLVSQMILSLSARAFTPYGALEELSLLSFNFLHPGALPLLCCLLLLLPGCLAT